MSYVHDAFPDFDDTLPKIDGFEDNSYKNDTCPNLLDKTRQLKLYIDYKDPAKSEHEEVRRDGSLGRYQLLSTDEEGETLEELGDTDSFDEILAMIAAHDSVVKLA
jgi:hypothetical protein